jgi:hypothetical protein
LVLLPAALPSPQALPFQNYNPSMIAVSITPLFGGPGRRRELLQQDVEVDLTTNVTGLGVDYEMQETPDEGVSVGTLGDALQSPSFTTEVAGRRQGPRVHGSAHQGLVWA